jgi:protein-tyrosine kinase
MKDTYEDMTSYHEDKTKDDDRDITQNVKSLVRVKRSIHVIEGGRSGFDNTVISPHFYNSINFSILMKEHNEGRLVIGITSANVLEGKTLVAANLAVSLALARQAKTLIVDLNVRKPEIHKIFGVSLAPGFVEALTELPITISQTSLKDLFVLSAGNALNHALAAMQLKPKSIADVRGTPAVGLDQLPAFRDIIYSLAKEFDFVIVDLPSIEETSLPVLFAKQLDGVIAVINAGKTKHRDVNKLLNLLGYNHALGFVVNRANVNELI